MLRGPIVISMLVLAALPISLSARRQWLLPSSTVLSDNDGWVTVDAAASDELFNFDSMPLRMTSLSITGPDGMPVKAQNTATSKFRTSFDIHLTQAGTYKIASVSDMVFANWKENGENKNWRGTAEAFKAEVPPNAEELKTARMSSRVEVFVTAGKPSTRALETTGVGLEMVAITHPNDLVPGDAANFKLLKDGKPAGNLDVTVIPGASRYRSQVQEMNMKTDSEGRFSVTFKEPGMYWLSVTLGGSPRPAGGGVGGGRGMMRFPTGDRLSYIATLEVLPQ